jgi:hypothetical protein
MLTEKRLEIVSELTKSKTQVTIEDNNSSLEFCGTKVIINLPTNL